MDYNLDIKLRHPKELEIDSLFVIPIHSDSYFKLVCPCVRFHFFCVKLIGRHFSHVLMKFDTLACIRYWKWFGSEHILKDFYTNTCRVCRGPPVTVLLVLFVIGQRKAFWNGFVRYLDQILGLYMLELVFKFLITIFLTTVSVCIHMNMNESICLNQFANSLFECVNECHNLSEKLTIHVCSRCEYEAWSECSGYPMFVLSVDLEGHFQVWTIASIFVFRVWIFINNLMNVS